MNKNAIWFTVAILTMMVPFFSCVPQPVPFLGGGAIVINIVPTFGGEEVKFNNVTPHTFDGEKITFEDFKFYLSNIVLEDEKGEFINLSEIKLVEFSPITGTATFNFRNIPLGDYQSIQFDIGVPASENADVWDPNRYGGSHPLNNESMYDQRFNSYKFLVLDGNIGEGTDLKTFTYGPGANDIFINNKVINSSISLTSEITTSYNIEVDLQTVLTGIDVLNELRTTPNNNLELGDDLLTNLRRAINEE